MKKALYELISKYKILIRYFNSHYSYHKYYKKYIGIDLIKKKNFLYIVCSKYRDVPLNKNFLYKAILIKYKNKWILSSSESCKDDIIHHIINLGKPKDLDYYADNLQIMDLKVRKMYRMIWDSVNSSKIEFRPEYEYVYMETFNKYVAKFNGNIISYCKISDIYFGFGNIVVFTNENFRNQGLATTLLNLLLIKCDEKNIFPLYMVDSINVASIHLAKKMGFSIVSQEVIMSKEIESQL